MIWTGDSARHDNDERHPRSDKQVTDLNKYMVHKFVEVFGKPDNSDDPDPTNDFLVPIVPTLGNNDILPHNIFTPGPNRWTRRFASIWRKFVPEEQRHSFERGGWFFTEVIPNKLAVFSLNTLYFFESNSAVDGCNAKSEPGYEHMEWLRIQLQFLRQRGMKAIMTGHVPPARTDSKRNWDESCWQKYTLWMKQYRDVVVGGLYGHMNIDHFIFQDTKNLEHDFKRDEIELDEASDGLEIKISRREQPSVDFTTMAKSTYLNELRDYWSDLPVPPRGLTYSTLDDDQADVEKDSRKEKQRKKFLKNIGGPWAERFSLSLVSPSVVPNFFPTLRVIQYNISGLENEHPAEKPTGTPALFDELDVSSIELDSQNQKPIEIDKKKKKKPNKPRFKVPKPPSKSTPPGPAYSPQTFTFLGLTQYYANLTKINAEYEHIHRHTNNDRESLGLDNNKAQRKDHKVNFTYEVEYDTRNDKWYKLNDLTVRSWLDLAQGMRKKSKTKILSDHTTDLGDDENGVNPEAESGLASYPNAQTGGDFSDLNHEGNEDEVESQKKKKHKKKKKSRKLKNKTWKTFVKRAFVLTKPDGELDDEFGEDFNVEEQQGVV